MTLLVSSPLLFGMELQTTNQSFQLSGTPSAGGATLLELSQSESYEKGRSDAELQHTTAGWAVGGVISGAVFSLIGTGIIALIALASNPTPPFIPEDVDPSAYTRGYREVARKKNVRAAGIGGLILSSVWVLIALSAF